MSKRGFVYIVKSKKSNTFKLGWTERHPSTRLSELQSAHHEPLSLEGSIAAEPTLEKNLHTYFDHKRIRGEWFELNDAEVANILNKSWRERTGVEDKNAPSPPPWEKAGFETEEDWDRWQKSGFETDGWDEPILPDD